MNWFDRNAHWVLLTLSVVMAYVIVGFLGVSALALLAGAIGGTSLGALLADAAIVVGLTALMVVAEIVLAVAFVVTVVRRASFPTSDRLAMLFSVLEAVLPPLRDLALSRRFEPSFEKRKQDLKRRYVEGELSELAFEREMRDLFEKSEPQPAPVDHADQLDSLEPINEGNDRISDSLATDVLRSEKRRESERE